MEKETCNICGKVIEGYSKDHAKYLMAQHKLSHRNDEIEKEVQGNESQ